MLPARATCGWEGWRVASNSRRQRCTFRWRRLTIRRTEGLQIIGRGILSLAQNANKSKDCHTDRSWSI